MKNGKISESVLKRTVLKHLHATNERVVLKPAVGEDSAVISSRNGEDAIAASTQVLTLDIKDTEIKARVAVNSALNNIYAKGAKPVGILSAIIVPTTENEAWLRQLICEIDKACVTAGVAVLGGHTQVSRSVKNAVITITAIGDAELSNIKPSGVVRPGMDIIVTGYAGLEGTAILAKEKKEALMSRFSSAFLDKAAGEMANISVANEAKSAMSAGVTAMHDVSEGGIFGALWELAEASRVGVEIDIKKLPIKQETVEISEFFDVNPYKLLSGGSLVIAAYDGNSVVREIERNNGMAVIVGKTTDSNDRVLLQGDDRRFIEMAQTDEIYKVL